MVQVYEYSNTTLLSGVTILCDILLIYYVCMLNAFSVSSLESSFLPSIGLLEGIFRYEAFDGMLL